ncbi:unnamed protein product [Phytophthora fragariaefolia]|uniref:Unnamed protein product n=1 Tax=Phytophthora fragariaefolia TaxID=1490495 RepID=A0A9W6XUY0_9STRA|nr:unnamed protein product [Phytophthora fragariaefolia]
MDILVAAVMLSLHTHLVIGAVRTGETTHDGCAIFVKESMFRIVSSHSIEYHVPDHPVLNRDNIALTAVVEAKSSAARFIVANTHLLFNPNVRVLACYCLSPGIKQPDDILRDCCAAWGN